MTLIASTPVPQRTGRRAHLASILAEDVLGGAVAYAGNAPRHLAPWVGRIAVLGPEAPAFLEDVRAHGVQIIGADVWGALHRGDHVDGVEAIPPTAWQRFWRQLRRRIFGA